MESKKTVVVTGASRGIGRATALTFAKNGWNVAAVYLKDDQRALELKKTVDASGGTCETFKCDVSSPAAVKITVQNIVGKYNRIDVLVNNAGIARDRTVANMTDEEWDSVIKTNLTGAFFLLRECAAFMEKEGGSVINIASIAGVKGNFGGANYAAAKAGLISLTKSAAREFGPQKIAVNAVLPGFHYTDMGKAILPKYAKKLKTESVLGVTTDIGELTDFILLLSRMKTVSGQVFNWDSRII